MILPGTFSPGHSPGEGDFGALTLLDTSHLIMEIAGRNPGQYDHITVAGQLVFDGILEIRLLNNFMPADGDVFDLFDWGSASGQFDEVLLPQLIPGLAWDISKLYVDGSVGVVDPPITSLAFDTAATTVPAPSVFALFAVGVVVIGVGHWRRRFYRKSARRA